MAAQQRHFDSRGPLGKHKNPRPQFQVAQCHMYHLKIQKFLPNSNFWANKKMCRISNPGAFSWGVVWRSMHWWRRRIRLYTFCILFLYFIFLLLLLLFVFYFYILCFLLVIVCPQWEDKGRKRYLHHHHYRHAHHHWNHLVHHHHHHQSGVRAWTLGHWTQPQL